MRRQRPGFLLLALLCGAALIAAACSSSSKSGSAGSGSSASSSSSAPAPPEGCFSTTGKLCTTSKRANLPAAMTVTVDLNPKAVWDDGSPITIADFQCTADAYLDTPGSLVTVGYDHVLSIEKGSNANEMVVSFDQVYAPYKNILYNIIKKAAVSNCQDISNDFQDSLPFSGGEWKIDSFSKDQETLSPNANYWDSSKTPLAKQIIMTPKTDSDTEISSIKSGESDFIFPQAYAGFDSAISDPNIKTNPGYGLQYEDVYFQQKTGPFSDATFRQAFFKLFDRQKMFDSIYKPIFPTGQPLNCIYWVPTVGSWCEGTAFANTYDPTGGEKLLTDAGWKKNGDGLWADKNGKVPTIRWLVNTGNKRRADSQALMIPLLKTAGFNVVADNCDSACMFQKRIPALDYDMTMYISQVTPDPTVTQLASCEQVPQDSNGNQGYNTTGWCNQQATDLMHQSDAELDNTKRADEIHQIDQMAAQDAVALPMFQFPNIAAWRSDKLSGPIGDDAANYLAFMYSSYKWKTTDPSGVIKIGAEQWPDCLNPVTDCESSSWAQWIAMQPVLPSIWDTDAKGNYVLTSLATAEPTVKVLNAGSSGSSSSSGTSAN